MSAKRSHAVDRLAELAAFVADGWENLPDTHKTVWHNRAELALAALNGARDAQGQRRLIREALLLAGTQGETSVPAVDLAKRARLVAAYVADAHAALGGMLAQLCNTEPSLVIDALLAHSKRPGRGKPGDTTPSRRETLTKLYARLGIARDVSLFGRRAPLELP